MKRASPLLEVLGAALLLAVLASAASAVFLDRLALTRKLRAESDAQRLLDGVCAALARAFAAAPPGASSLPWRFGGVADTLDLVGAGTIAHPRPLPFLDPEAPRWEVYPWGRPEPYDPRPGVHHEAGRPAWRVVAPLAAGPAEGPPLAAGWDRNRNGVRDVPYDLPGLPASLTEADRPLCYAIEITPPAAPGEPHLVRAVVFRTRRLVYAPAGGPPTVQGAEELSERRLELRPGGLQ